MSKTFELVVYPPLPPEPVLFAPGWVDWDHWREWDDLKNRDFQKRRPSASRTPN
jgi:hypothetical protein